MYTGEIVERAPVDTIFDRNTKYAHPYKEGLLKSIPVLDEEVEYLDQIEGSVPHPLKLPIGCRFSTRCEYATDKCINEKPELVEVESGHLVRCFYPEAGCRNA
jgi:peptide/nickel transport system ATP-binding protein